MSFQLELEREANERLEIGQGIVNAKNTGVKLEAMIREASKRYQGKLYLEKTDPPVVVFKGRVVQKSNPWLDYAGVWKEKRGRMIIIESKAVTSNRLRLGAEGGITERQLLHLRKWHHAGAFVGVIWQNSEKFGWLEYHSISQDHAAGARSIAFEKAIPIKCYIEVSRSGAKTLWVDFLPAMETDYQSRINRSKQTQTQQT